MKEKIDQIILKLPVRIRYEVLQEYFRQELVGEVIKKKDKDGKETAYAEILALSVEKSPEEEFDLTLHLRLRTLYSFYKGKFLRLSLHVALEFVPGEQRIAVREYSLKGGNSNWFTNKFIELLGNSFLYSTLKSKMQVELLPVIREQVERVNQMLMEKLEVHQGIRLSGVIRQFEISDLIPAEKYLVISVGLSGNALLDIDKLDLKSLIPEDSYSG